VATSSTAKLLLAEQRVVSDTLQFALRASRGDDLPVHGDGTSHRSFLFVEDVAEAFDVVLHKVGSAFLRRPVVRQQACTGTSSSQLRTLQLVLGYPAGRYWRGL
jgi:nucleoside-diphosphate-sugar epimerase